MEDNVRVMVMIGELVVQNSKLTEALRNSEQKIAELEMKKEKKNEVLPS